MEPIERLARDDKWQLGCGDGTIFAPRAPLWLDRPGFWDGGTIYQYTFEPLFTVTFLDARGRELPLRLLERRWTPAEVTAEYRLPLGITATEVRTVQPGGIFASEWRLRALRPTEVHLIGWTAQDAASVELESVAWTGALSFARTLIDRHDVPLRVSAELTCTGESASWSAMLGAATPIQPHWRLAPFGDQWQFDRLPDILRLDTAPSAAHRGGELMFAAVHRAVEIGADEAAASFAMRVAPSDPALRSPPAADAGARATVTTASTLGGASRRRWADLVARVPAFRCSDPFFETYYWYRWYGLWLNAIAPGTGNYQHHAMCEGIDAAHRPAVGCAHAHVRELRWMHDAEPARGVFRTFFANQTPDGGLPGRIFVNHLDTAGFRHANWGDALLALDAVAPDGAFSAEMYFRLSRYADWLLRTRDAEASGLFDLTDRFETGVDAAARCLPIDPHAHEPEWQNRVRLKAVDATVYAYALLRALEQLARRAGGGSEAEVARWQGTAERTRRAVRERMWDAATGMFSDLHPATGQRTGVAAAQCFYPYVTDIATSDHTSGLERNLLDPARFWTPFPVPSLALDDPSFSASGNWRGRRDDVPGNGRVWPQINSHLVDALARQATPGATRLRDATAHLLRRYVRMLFHDGELERPNSFEHYNPVTGSASEYRGLDDHQDSWVIDLLLQLVTGIRPHDRGITIDPFPFGLDVAEASNVRLRGAILTVRVERDRFRVEVDGRRHEGTVGVPIELAR